MGYRVVELQVCAWRTVNSPTRTFEAPARARSRTSVFNDMNARHFFQSKVAYDGRIRDKLSRQKGVAPCINAVSLLFLREMYTIMRNDCTNCSCVNRSAHDNSVAEAFTSPVIDLSNLVPSVFSRCHSLTQAKHVPIFVSFTPMPLKTRGKNGDNYCSKKALEECEDDGRTTGATDSRYGRTYGDRQQLDRHGLHSSIFGRLVYRMPGSHIKSFQESLTTK